MKKVLMSIEGYVLEVHDPGQEYDIYNGADATFVWVDAPDDVTLDWTLEWSPAQQKMIWVERDGPPVDNGMLRKVAYGTLESQLDMMYHDAMDGTSRWKDHITMVKNNIPRPDPEPEPMSAEEEMALDQIEEPSVDRRMKLSSGEMPAWKRYPGWSGYNAGGE